MNLNVIYSIATRHFPLNPYHSSNYIFSDAVISVGSMAP